MASFNFGKNLDIVKAKCTNYVGVGMIVAAALLTLAESVEDSIEVLKNKLPKEHAFNCDSVPSLEEVEKEKDRKFRSEHDFPPARPSGR